jgi:hypothetical protein
VRGIADTSFSVDAKCWKQLGEHIEILVLSPDAKIVRQRSRRDDRVHRTGTPSGSSRGCEQLPEALGDVLVIGQRNESRPARP